MKGNLRPFLDVLLCCICVLAAIIMLLRSVTETEQRTVKTNTIYKIVMTWPIAEGGKNKQCDVDLWVKDPHNHIVGFKRREGGDGSLMVLTHDDVGNNQDDKVEEHVEEVNLRGTVVGEYIVNAHYYAKRQDAESVEVTAKLVRLKPFKEVIEKKVLLFNSGDEKTFFRFSLDKDANVTNTNELPASIAVQN